VQKKKLNKRSSGKNHEGGFGLAMKTLAGELGEN